MRVAFIHPDLGIGGAERLVVDAAVALQKKGHQVNIFTGYHNKDRAFPETFNGTLNVKVYGGWIPRSIFNRMYALLAYIRMMWVAFCVLFSAKFDVVFIDSVSAPIPFIKLFSKSKVLFYCHFPDLLLTTRATFLKKLYRMPLDWWEEYTTGKADKILVNSKFTAEKFRQTFKRIRQVPEVLYPAINTDEFDMQNKEAEEQLGNLANQKFILSVNRFEKKKNIKLLVEAFSLLPNEMVSPRDFEQIKLVLAGGYDERIEDQRNCYGELQKDVADEKLKDQVKFWKDVSHAQKVALYKKCICVAYTPTDEHFGIVPVEAMYCGKPVIAINRGGPKESVLHEQTGLLCEPEPPSFATQLSTILSKSDAALKEMGKQATAHVKANFSLPAFADRLDHIVKELFLGTNKDRGVSQVINQNNNTGSQRRHSRKKSNEK